MDAIILFVQRSDRQQLVEDLKVSRRAMAREFFAAVVAALGETDLTLAQLSAMILLSDGQPRPVSELAELLGRSLSATSRLLDQLVRRRFLTRREDPHDRRARRIALAAAGQRLVDLLFERRAEAQVSLMSALSAQEQRQVSEAMALLAAAARRKATTQEVP
jgi:DNA-binding MarR family transcriptional regulator